MALSVEDIQGHGIKLAMALRDKQWSPGECIGILACAIGTVANNCDIPSEMIQMAQVIISQHDSVKEVPEVVKADPLAEMHKEGK